MSSNLQKTIREPIEFKGVGLHNGIDANLCLKPAEANSGIKFRRTDVDFDKSIIEANYENVNSPLLCTKIKNQHGFCGDPSDPQIPKDLGNHVKTF